MKNLLPLLLIPSLYVLTVPVLGKDRNPADYTLVVRVLASQRQTQLVYRGTDCTSTGTGEIDETDTLTAHIYTTCSPDLAAQQYVFTELDVTNNDPTIKHTVRFLGQCADRNTRVSAAHVIGGLGNAMAAAGGTPEQRAEAEQRSREAQPVPPASKCDLLPGDYAGRWQNGKLELLLNLPHGKHATIGFIVSVVTVKQDTPVNRYAKPTSKEVAQTVPGDPRDVTDPVLDGNFLLPNCEDAIQMQNGKSDGTNVGFLCLGYIDGVVAMATDWQASHREQFLPCLPTGRTGIEAGQAIRIVVKYLDSHPEKLHKDAHILVVEALRESFPCQ